MTAPRITILYNNSQNHAQNNGNAAGDSNWKPLDPLNDKISFLSSSMENGDSIATKDPFKIPESISSEIPKHFVRNYEQSKWKRIYLAGSNKDGGLGGNYRYAYGAYIDGTSNTAPILQAWDSTSLSTYTLEVLGNGNPDNSMIKAVATTRLAPGDSWEGTPLAGSGVANSIALDTGPIVNPQMVYWNMRLVVPSTANSFSASPVLCIYVTYQ